MLAGSAVCSPPWALRMETFSLWEKCWDDMLVTHLAKVIWLPNSMFILSAVQMYDTLRLWVVRGPHRGPGSKFLCMTL